MSQFGGISEDFNREKKYSQVYFDRDDNIRSDVEKYSPIKSPIKKSKIYFEEDILNASQTSIQTQFLNLENT